MAWLLVPYRIRVRTPEHRCRYPAIDDYRGVIDSAGGVWEETEVLGDHCLVFLKAPQAVVTQVARDSDFIQLPDDLSNITSKQASTIVAQLEKLGFPVDEIRQKLGEDLKSISLKTLLLFLAQRRRTPAYDKELQQFVFTDEVVQPKPIEELEKVRDSEGKR